MAKPVCPVLQSPSAATLVAAGTATNPEFGPPGPGPALPSASGQKHNLSPKTLPSAKGALAHKKAQFAAGT